MGCGRDISEASIHRSCLSPAGGDEGQHPCCGKTHQRIQRIGVMGGRGTTGLQLFRKSSLCPSCSFSDTASNSKNNDTSARIRSGAQPNLCKSRGPRPSPPSQGHRKVAEGAGPRCLLPQMLSVHPHPSHTGPLSSAVTPSFNSASRSLPCTTHHYRCCRQSSELSLLSRGGMTATSRQQGCLRPGCRKTDSDSN